VVAQRLRVKVKHDVIPLKNQLQLSVSVTVGIATLNSETETIDDLLLAADTALQDAMASGIDRVHVYQTGQDESLVA
jgi:diguanylate cyclase (GGDEF)-like protein